MFKGLFKLLMVGVMLTALGCNISGTVTDSDGNPIEGVTVTLTGAAEQVTTTGADGKYSFANLNMGTFTVTPTSEPRISVKLVCYRIVNHPEIGAWENCFRFIENLA